MTSFAQVFSLTQSLSRHVSHLAEHPYVIALPTPPGCSTCDIRSETASHLTVMPSMPSPGLECCIRE